MISLQDAELTSSTSNVQNQCFLAVFSTIEQMDYLGQDYKRWREFKYFNVLVYDPVHIWNNMAASFEYCNGYLWFSQARLFLSGDYGFIAEIVTRWWLLATEQSVPFYNELYKLFSATYIDWYQIGFTCGNIFKYAFDVIIN